MSKSDGCTNTAFELYPEPRIYTTQNGNVTDNKEETKVEPESQTKERPNWSNGVEFLMSCISMSVGLGNIWRFPFTAYENGGGAFVIPYICVLILIGKPMYYLEMILGQFTSRSSVKIWKISPIFKGVGIGQMCATICVITYYCSLIALTVFYMVMSCQGELPWSKCREEWGENCVDSKLEDARNITFQGQAKSSSELYFTRDVLDEKSQIFDGIGAPNWKLTISLFVAWVVVFLVIVRGVKSSGKAAYFLALFPYVVLITLLIRAVTLDGAVDGIIFFLKPNWKELLNPKVWYSATTQLFFSLSVGMGTIIMFSSYNEFNHNIYRDAVIVTTLDTFTSLLAGITIFGILGNLAHNLKIDDISKVVRSGTGLAFISYPDAIAKFDAVPQVFSVLFFFMLFVLGVGSVVALQSAVVSVICDQFTSLKFSRVALGTCIVGFFTGLIYITPGGQWMLNLVDYFGGTFLIFALAIVEMAAIFWIYGLENFCNDVKFMTNRHVTAYWRVCWTIITPGLMTIIFIYAMANLQPLKYSGWDYPDSAYYAGWTLLIFGFLQFPIWGLYGLMKNRKSTLLETFKSLINPGDQWGPRDPNLRAEWMKFKTEAIEERKRISKLKGHNWIKQKIYVLFGKY